MTISEPTTLITDFLLGGLTSFLAWRLHIYNRMAGQRAIGRWAVALAAVAAASFAGGTYHGFGPEMAPSAAAGIWTATTLAMGAASYFLLVSVISATCTGATRHTLAILAAFKLGFYSLWMLWHHEFIYVILEYGSTLLLALVLLAANLIRGVPGHRAYLSGGILVSIAAALIQQSGIRIHAHFNHNDLMHVVQMGAVWLLYEGGRRLQDADGGHDGTRS